MLDKGITCLSAIGVSLRNDPGLGRRGSEGDEDWQDGEEDHGWTRCS